MKMRVVHHIAAGDMLRKYGLEKNGAVQKMLVIHCAHLMDPYVPMSPGAGAHMKDQRIIVDDGVIYPGSYAHYQYIGKVMGPNVQLPDGTWISPVAPKHYTGALLKYHGAPMRGARWDARMWEDHKDDILRAVREKIGGKK